MKPQRPQRPRQLLLDDLAEFGRKVRAGRVPGNDERDQFVRRRCDCHRVFHGRRATQDVFEFGGFDASPVDLQLASFATDDPQQTKIVQLDEVTRRENSNAWIVRIRLGGNDSAVLPMTEQNIGALDQEFAALARLNGTSLVVDDGKRDSWKQPTSRDRSAVLRQASRHEPLRAGQLRRGVADLHQAGVGNDLSQQGDVGPRYFLASDPDNPERVEGVGRLLGHERAKQRRHYIGDRCFFGPHPTANGAQPDRLDVDEVQRGAGQKGSEHLAAAGDGGWPG